jgi:DNA-binding response OmpR family regulator
MRSSVLLVEGDEAIARLIAAHLERHGLEVTVSRADEAGRFLLHARGEFRAPRVLTAGPIALDTGAMTATLDGRQLALTSYELALLRAFVERPGIVLSREQLLELAKGSLEESFDRSIDGHISRLRHKLGDDSRRPRLLKTVRGAGYLLVANTSAH